MVSYMRRGFYITYIPIHTDVRMIVNCEIGDFFNLLSSQYVVIRVVCRM